LQVAVDVALELGADDADVGKHVRAKVLLVDEVVLVVGKEARDRNDEHSHDGRNIRRLHQVGSELAKSVAGKGQAVTGSGDSQS
jgi:hypothetical protein